MHSPVAQHRLLGSMGDGVTVKRGPSRNSYYETSGLAATRCPPGPANGEAAPPARPGRGAPCQTVRVARVSLLPRASNLSVGGGQLPVRRRLAGLAGGLRPGRRRVAAQLQRARAEPQPKAAGQCQWPPAGARRPPGRRHWQPEQLVPSVTVPPAAGLRLNASASAMCGIADARPGTRMRRPRSAGPSRWARRPATPGPGGLERLEARSGAVPKSESRRVEDTTRYYCSK
jgi:hypothetical protein